MKMITVFLTALAVAVAAPRRTSSSKLAAIRALPALEHEVAHDGIGQYAFRFVTAEGIIIEEHGHLVPVQNGSERDLVVEGIVSYVGDDGKKYVTKYKAGPDGNRVEGDHLPIAPQPEQQ